MIIPKKIKIGGTMFNIRIDNNICEKTATDRTMGQMDYFIGEIWLRETVPNHMKELTLLHEIIEAINEAHQLGLKHNQISTLETALHQVLKDNKIHF